MHRRTSPGIAPSLPAISFKSSILYFSLSREEIRLDLHRTCVPRRRAPSCVSVLTLVCSYAGHPVFSTQQGQTSLGRVLLRYVLKTLCNTVFPLTSSKLLAAESHSWLLPGPQLHRWSPAHVGRPRVTC